MIKTKRVYEQVDENDGVRFFVERLWPRGIKKENLFMNAWLKDVSPSPELRSWYKHDLTKWVEFQQRYKAELDENPDTWKPLIKAALEGNLTLLYAARDEEHNSALVLKNYLDKYLLINK